jgi:hypothetical protein
LTEQSEGYEVFALYFTGGFLTKAISKDFS